MITPTVNGLQETIKKAKYKILKHNSYGRMSRTTAWKAVIIDGFCTDLLNKAVIDLANGKCPARAQMKIEAVGILQVYLDGIADEADLSKMVIEAAEDELAQLRSDREYE